MTPFAEKPVLRDRDTLVARRDAFLALGDEFFSQVFGGCVPPFPEKVARVEAALQAGIPERVLENDIYRVDVTRNAPFITLTIRRHDGGPVREWRHLQQIKNEVVGPEFEAVELFPAESRLVDTANEYHLWVHADPGSRFALGWPRRCVLSEPVRYSGGDSIASGCAGPGGAIHNSTQAITIAGGVGRG